MAEIKFCENNFIHGTEEVSEKLKENFPDSSVEVESCLGFCSDCSSGPYALVDDELVQGDCADELYKTIAEMIKG